MQINIEPHLVSMNKEQIMLKLILGMARAHPELYLGYQRHMLEVAEAIEQDNIPYAEELTTAVCNEIDKFPHGYDTKTEL